MKNVVVILLIVGAAFGTWRFYKHSEGSKATGSETSPSKSIALDVTEDQLPRMHEQLESSLSEARQRGAYGLKQWLTTYGASVKDPRLAWIQLDYVILVSQSDLGEARRVFDLVKKRMPTTSVVYPRIQKLESSYGTPKE